jgi:histone acetyltransferase (RNA polymerase elongator complex component)
MVSVIGNSHGNSHGNIGNSHGNIHARGKAFPELEGAALIRELHVYGSFAQIGETAHSSRKVQHQGIGKP